MSMVIRNNIAAQMTLGELNKNNETLKKSLEKVSSGEKIKGAKDDASSYAISEKMREQIRSLTQDNQNVQNGSSMLKITAGGVDNIVEELRSLKELAINAANDSNSDRDRRIIQKEFTQKMANINDIATMTNYNGKILLDGTYADKVRTATVTVTDPSDTETVSNDPIMIYDDGYTISNDGVYVLAKNFTGTVNVNAQNIKITQEDSTTTLSNVTLLGRGEGNANLWIEDLNIHNIADKNIIKFQGTNNVLSVKGENYLKLNPTEEITTDPNATNYHSATINTGKGLTIQGEQCYIGSYQLRKYKKLSSTSLLAKSRSCHWWRCTKSR